MPIYQAIIDIYIYIYKCRKILEHKPFEASLMSVFLNDFGI